GSAHASDPSAGRGRGRTPHDPRLAHGPLPAGIHGPAAADPTQASDPADAALGTADVAVQQAWNDGSADPFQDVRHPPRALVIAVIAIVGIGLGGVCLLRCRLLLRSPSRLPGRQAVIASSSISICSMVCGSSTTSANHDAANV